MGTESVIEKVTISKVLKSVCVVCGSDFKRKRAGKMYCSNKCKQFSYYHKPQLKALLDSEKESNQSVTRISLKEFQQYKNLRRKLEDWKALKKRSESKYGGFGLGDQLKMDNLEKLMPEYLRECRLPDFSIESWSFMKTCYAPLSKENFIKLVSNFDVSLFECLEVSKDTNKIVRRNPVTILFERHIENILNGTIQFS